jgi:hypothetical protein
MRGLGIYPTPVSQIHHHIHIITYISSHTYHHIHIITYISSHTYHHIHIINIYTTNITKRNIPNTPLIVDQFLRCRLALHVLLYKNNHSKAARGLPSPGAGPTHRPGSRFTRHPCAYTSLSKATHQRTRSLASLLTCPKLR